MKEHHYEDLEDDIQGDVTSVLKGLKRSKCASRRDMNARTKVLGYGMSILSKDGIFYVLVK